MDVNKYFIFSTLIVLDVITTFIAILYFGAQEMNPFLNFGGLAITLMMVFITHILILVFIHYLYISKILDKNKLLNRLFYFLIVYYLIVCSNNIYQIIARGLM